MNRLQVEVLSTKGVRLGI